jgi:hypothetical protein
MLQNRQFDEISLGSHGHELHPTAHDAGGVVAEPIHGRAQGDHRPDGVELEFERRDHAEVAAATAHGPEQIGVLVGWR